ncbi:MAG: hypothetical protein HYT39_00605 [Candidatus Sungbacteria bacterium]|nr:hypothetical protein [Candidatus Sungbacteria bacterium]
MDFEVAPTTTYVVVVLVGFALYASIGWFVWKLRMWLEGGERAMIVAEIVEETREIKTEAIMCGATLGEAADFASRYADGFDEKWARSRMNETRGWIIFFWPITLLATLMDLPELKKKRMYSQRGK